ncbi:RagB/SusD family nutrient uptake outer membrane protein [uncultured Bacteroides sp.]|uniref:RagB/SusD family nutrient uptake outer membrane protein n=1 Tax=uncultured Bacteroides sp. TaxID=162156 RepID=UPI0025D043CC|nr:RagB/SusD family nutrient uptake outer membrane protein [uncultured Bacteroides sp.]
MKRKRYMMLWSVILLIGGCLCSCTDWLETQPNDKQSEKQQFATKDGFYAAVNGVYNRMGGGSLYGKYLSYELIDILGQYYQVEKDNEAAHYKYLRALTKWDYTEESVSKALASIWGDAYQVIMNINVILKNLEEDAVTANILPVKEYAMLKGEMLAARAMLHFDLLRLFGPVYTNNPEGQGIPYNESTETDILPFLTARDVLENYILRDLTDAEELLLNSDPVVTEGPRAEYDKVTLDNSMRYRQLRLNYYATVLLTARAYLWAENFDAALQEARKLTEDAKVDEYFPVVDFSKLLQNQNDPDRMFSTETLFGFYNKDRGLIYKYSFGKEDSYKNLLVPRTGYIDGQLFASPDAGDIRLSSQWEDRKTLEEEPSMALTKFKDINDKDKDDAAADKDDTSILQAQKFYGTFCSSIKLIEAYYIAAEALGRQGNTLEGQRYVDRARQRRNLGTYGADYGMEWLQTFLNQEYTREFPGEGQKFFYFKRTNQGFDNQFNGCKEVKTMTSPGLPPFIPPSYDYKDKADDATKEARFVAPIPKDELDNR